MNADPHEDEVVKLLELRLEPFRRRGDDALLRAEVLAAVMTFFSEGLRHGHIQAPHVDVHFEEDTVWVWLADGALDEVEKAERLLWRMIHPGYITVIG